MLTGSCSRWACWQKVKDSIDQNAKNACLLPHERRQDIGEYGVITALVAIRWQKNSFRQEYYCNYKDEIYSKKWH